MSDNYSSNLYVPLESLYEQSGSEYASLSTVVSDQFVNATTYSSSDGTPGAYVLQSTLDMTDLSHNIERFVEAFKASTTTEEKKSLRNYFFRFLLPSIKSVENLEGQSDLLMCVDKHVRSEVTEHLRSLVFRMNIEKVDINSLLSAIDNITSFLIYNEEESAELGIPLLADFAVALLIRERINPREQKIILSKMKEINEKISRACKKNKESVLSSIHELLSKCVTLKMTKVGSTILGNMEETTIPEVESQRFIQNIHSVSPLELYVILLGLIYKLQTSPLNSSISDSFVKFTKARLQSQSPQRGKKYNYSPILLANFIARGFAFLFERNNFTCHDEIVKECLIQTMQLLLSPRSMFTQLPPEVLGMMLKIERTDAHVIWSNMSLSDEQYQSMVLKHAQRQIPGLVIHDIDSYRKDEGKSSDHSLWLSANGTFMSRYEVQVKVLVPGRHAIKLNVTLQENTNYRNIQNEFDVLKNIQINQRHQNVAQMLAFFDSDPPSFQMFAVERYAKSLLKYFYIARGKNEILQYTWKIKCCLDMVSAIHFLHFNNIVHRGIMSDAFSLRSNDPSCAGIVLTTLREAISNETTGETTSIGHVRDLSSTQIPSRWSAPESFLENTFNTKSDVWMLAHAIREVFTCGCQPYTELYSEDTENIMAKVIFCGLKPYKWQCIPKDIHKLTLMCLEMDPDKRPTVDDVYEGLNDIKIRCKKDSARSRRRSLVIVSHDARRKFYPSLSDTQMESQQERGIPKLIQDLRSKDVKDPRATYISMTSQNQSSRNSCAISATYSIAEADLKRSPIRDTGSMEIVEPVSTFFCEKILQKMSGDFENKMHIKERPVIHTNRRDSVCPYEIKYECPAGKNIIAYAREPMHSETDHLTLLIEVAKLMEKMHEKCWILVDVCAQNFYLSSSNNAGSRAFMPRIGRMLRLELPFDPEDDVVLCSELYSDRLHWHPVEVITNSEYSMDSDVYMLGMVFYEYYTAVGLQKTESMEEVELSQACIPFASIEVNKILCSLLNGEIPSKPDECPEWLYEDVMRPCWAQERTSRPSVKEIISIMNARLGNTEDKSENPRQEDVNDEKYLKQHHKETTDHAFIPDNRDLASSMQHDSTYLKTVRDTASSAIAGSGDTVSVELGDSAMYLDVINKEEDTVQGYDTKCKRIGDDYIQPVSENTLNNQTTQKEVNYSVCENEVRFQLPFNLQVSSQMKVSKTSNVSQPDASKPNNSSQTSAESSSSSYMSIDLRDENTLSKNEFADNFGDNCMYLDVTAEEDPIYSKPSK